jgi:hypothetical protein
MCYYRRIAIEAAPQALASPSLDWQRCILLVCSLLFTFLAAKMKEIYEDRSEVSRTWSSLT